MGRWNGICTPASVYFTSDVVSSRLLSFFTDRLQELKDATARPRCCRTAVSAASLSRGSSGDWGLNRSSVTISKSSTYREIFVVKFKPLEAYDPVADTVTTSVQRVTWTWVCSGVSSLRYSKRNVRKSFGVRSTFRLRETRRNIRNCWSKAVIWWISSNYVWYEWKCRDTSGAARQVQKHTRASMILILSSGGRSPYVAIIVTWWCQGGTWVGGINELSLFWYCISIINASTHQRIKLSNFRSVPQTQAWLFADYLRRT